jgi:hypothetical protein
VLRIFFGITTNLGWRIMGERLRDAIEQSDTLKQHSFEAFTLPRALRHVTWTAHYSDSERAPLPVLDPHLSFYLASRGPRRRAKDFDAVVAATSPMAAAFVADPSSPPVFQIVDATRDICRRDFGIRNISDAAIAREREHFRQVKHTFCLSHWVRRNIIDVYGVAPDRVSVIPPMAPCSATVARLQPKRPSSPRLQVAFVGGDFVRKGGDRLLRWQTERLHPLVDLHVVTESRFRSDHVPNTHWYGPLGNRAVVEDLLPGMDLLCHPTTRDCSAIVVAEAAIAGVPSMTTTVGGVPELIEHGRTGYAFDAEDDVSFVGTITELAGSPEVLTEMKVQARKKAQAEFVADVVFARILAQVDQSLSGKGTVVTPTLPSSQPGRHGDGSPGRASVGQPSTRPAGSDDRL